MVKVAPVCHIAPLGSDANPIPKNLPAIPPATNLASALAAINAMRQIIQIITNQQNVTINNPPPPPANAKVQWAEARRTTETVRIFNPADKTQYVDVERINSLTMVDKNSGQTWLWNRTKT